MSAESNHSNSIHNTTTTGGGPSYLWVGLKALLAVAFFSAGVRHWNPRNHDSEEAVNIIDILWTDTRRLSEVDIASSSSSSLLGGGLPSYLQPLMEELNERKKLFAEAEVIKYWFEYTGPLQKYYYRFSKSRGKADYFEGRDDSGVVSARFMEDLGGNQEFRDGYAKEESLRTRLLENCLAMGSARRPNRSRGSTWDVFFGQSNAPNVDRCRILFTLNTVGAGRGTIMLWETTPPPIHNEGPFPFVSEQESAVPHLQRNLQEIDSMCATGIIAARVQLLVCEPIDSTWVDWMDSLLVNCGGKPWPMDRKPGDDLEDRPSPLQIVVASTASEAAMCHDLKSGYMERRAQSLILSVPPEGERAASNGKMQSATLVSSDDHDLYVSLNWSTLVTLRAVSAFVQASADLAAAANAPALLTNDASLPASPFLVPSFVPVSYLSEENAKTAKWRMHGDFFHPATVDIVGDSFDMAWIPGSLAAPERGIKTICQPNSPTIPRKLKEGNDCGQWWLYFVELQMPVSPEVFANERTPPLVQGGSNSVWMLTERQREEMVAAVKCRRDKTRKDCLKPAQGVIPLGDMESFLVNFMPNTKLGKRHTKSRRPGYTHEEEREAARKEVHKRDQFDGEDDMESALFDYVIYPAALMRKDATVKAARDRDFALSSKGEEGEDSESSSGPQTVKSSYYDITITKPRPPILGWCQAAARRGLCALYAEYFRTSNDARCLEACGLKKDFTPVDQEAE